MYLLNDIGYEYKLNFAFSDNSQRNSEFSIKMYTTLREYGFGHVLQTSPTVIVIGQWECDAHQTYTWQVNMHVYGLSLLQINIIIHRIIIQ